MFRTRGSSIEAPGAGSVAWVAKGNKIIFDFVYLCPSTVPCLRGRLVRATTRQFQKLHVVPDIEVHPLRSSRAPLACPGMAWRPFMYTTISLSPVHLPTRGSSPRHSTVLLILHDVQMPVEVKSEFIYDP